MKNYFLRKIVFILLAYASRIPLEISTNINNSKIEINNKIVIEKEIMIVEIPKINFIGKVYSKDSKLNDIDKNIIIMNESDYPDKEKGIVIIGGHSGVGELAYFKNLNKLVNKDIVKVKYNKKEYTYEVVNYYLDDKNGNIVINNSNNRKKLFLYTCNPFDKKNYLVVVLEEKK